jgi:hypothetical protein
MDGELDGMIMPRNAVANLVFFGWRHDGWQWFKYDIYERIIAREGDPTWEKDFEIAKNSA